MANSEGKGQNQNPAPPEANGDSKKAPEVGPLGRTRSEDQRRRLIVAGLSTPALMTLPSRRVWATKCSKSKLMSGNLSAKKKSQTALDCEPMGCGRSFWTSNDGALFDNGAWMLESFNSHFPGVNGIPLFVIDTLGSVVDAKDGDWDTLLTPEAKDDFGTDFKDEAARALIKVARELAAAVLNDMYIRWPVPNDQFNFDQNTGFPPMGLQEFWSVEAITPPALYLPPGDDAKAALAAGSQVSTAAYDNARDAGHWADRHAFYEAAEQAAKIAGDKPAEDEAEEQKDAAAALFKLAREQVEAFEKPIKDLNKLHCPFK